MNKFGEGQRVICVDNSGVMETYLKNGQVYTIQRVFWDRCNRQHIVLKGVRGAKPLSRRFKLAEMENV